VGHGILREIGEPASVAVWLAVADAPRAKRMLEQIGAGPSSQTVLARGEPVIYVMNTVAAQMDPEAVGLSAAIVRLRVADFAAWQRAFENDAEARKNVGIVGYGVGQDIDDPSLVYLYLQAADPERLEAYVESKQTRRAWKRAGVKGRAQATFVAEGEQVLYP
jgi:quinol monooxygenase YgiN